MEILVRILLILSPPARWGEQDKEMSRARLILYKAIYKLYIRAQKRLGSRIKDNSDRR